MEHYKVLTTQRLRDLANDGLLARFNRVVDPIDEFVAPCVIDEGGLHLAILRIDYHNAADKSLPAHHRVEVMVRIQGSEEPFCLLMDVAADSWATLPGLDVVRAGAL